MMVVEVLTISCQVSENCRKGPEKSHTVIAHPATRKADGLPIISDITDAIFENFLFTE